ncbi:hypothetical protein [Nocardia flavorosea]|uniref:DUF3592 domain-containing protein n=1 Tax=Nocardia flavorosea TaxID=53429 RepID=A0A846YJW5_9NOCA|nr:hypothetical protein [Nocardia flavorosea]NKY59215.1 hypothetical protein [Nocardia flavorosea]
MTPPNESAPGEGEFAESEAAEPAFTTSRPLADSGFTAGDWILGLFLPLVALATVSGALWYSAFLAPPGADYDAFGTAGVIGILWYIFFGFTDWARFGKRAAALLIVPLLLSGACLGFGVYNLAMEHRGVVLVCEVRVAETSRAGSRETTTYSLDCGERRVSVQREADSGPGLLSTDRGSIRIEYDPRGLLGVREQNIGAPSWPWLLASLALAVAGIGIRMLIRPAPQTRSS